MPLARKRLVHVFILSFVPHGRRRDTFLPEGIDGDNPVSPRVFVLVRVDEAIVLHGIDRHARYRLPGAVDAGRLHAINAIASE